MPATEKEPKAVKRPRSYIRKRCFFITAVTLASYAYFYQGGGWNQNSRFDMSRAIVEWHTLSIDAFRDNTHDRVLSSGHFYSDKAPGLALLATPVVWAAPGVMRAIQIDPGSGRGLVAASYLASVVSVAVPTALACACLFLVALRLGATIGAATFAALAMGLATPLWPYATLLWGHALVGACLLFAFAAAIHLAGRSDTRNDWFWGIAVGLAAGWATVSEYPAGPASVILAVFTLSQVWPGGWGRRLPTAVGILAGALPCVGVLMLYQRAAFGSAFHPSYSYYEEATSPWMQHGYLGLNYPHALVVLKLLLGCRRGLLYFAPVLIAAPFGLTWLWKNKLTRGAAITASAISVYYLLFNASFSAWQGGESYGPRYLGAAIPILCVGLAPAFAGAAALCRKLLLGLALCGGFFSVMAVAVAAAPPNESRCPLMGFLWPSFWSGHLSFNHWSMLLASEIDGQHNFGATNFGELLGLRGLASLLPLASIWVLAAIYWYRMNREGSSQHDQ